MKTVLKTTLSALIFAILTNTMYSDTKNPNYRVPMGKVTHMNLNAEKPKPKQPTQQPTQKKPETPQPQQTVKTETKSKQEIEYAKSIGNLNISLEAFVEDKNSVLKAIKDLEDIMATQNYTKWLEYIDSESTEYWKQISNLKRLQARLTNKNIQLKNLQDYFRLMFIPSRQKSFVTEIRYVTDTYVKAVEVKEDKDIICYYFNKVDGKWLVNIPKL